jgi:hypothetical protein
MSYCIFLKSLRILEEFRKKTLCQNPPKSPCANFQSPAKFKNPIFYFEKEFLSASAQSAQPPNQPARHFGPPDPPGFLLPPCAEQSRHHHRRPCATSPRRLAPAHHGAIASSAAPHPTPVSPSPSFNPRSKTAVKSELCHPH